MGIDYLGREIWTFSSQTNGSSNISRNECFFSYIPRNEEEHIRVSRNCHKVFKDGMAHPAGFEPAASPSGGARSIQLSYGWLYFSCG